MSDEDVLKGMCSVCGDVWVTWAPALPITCADCDRRRPFITEYLDWWWYATDKEILFSHDKEQLIEWANRDPNKDYDRFHFDDVLSEDFDVKMTHTTTKRPYKLVYFLEVDNDGGTSIDVFTADKEVKP